jgi:hypothetical protein
MKRHTRKNPDNVRLTPTLNVIIATVVIMMKSHPKNIQGLPPQIEKNTPRKGKHLILKNIAVRFNLRKRPHISVR